MSKKKYREPKHALRSTFTLVGDDKAKIEKKYNKILDLLFDRHGKDIGVMSGVYVPGDLYENAAERALARLRQPAPMPLGKNASFTHGYNLALRYAERVVREELTRYHGE